VAARFFLERERLSCQVFLGRGEYQGPRCRPIHTKHLGSKYLIADLLTHVRRDFSRKDTPRDRSHMDGRKKLAKMK
jgi:hypothetical protein